MPIIYLSPSTQEGNMYVTGGSEEYYMNLIADAMVPYLNSSGIQFTRNSPFQTAADAIAQSNRGNYDLHLALHSNAAPPDRYGTIRGVDVYYDPRSPRGRRAAQIFAGNLRSVYPIPSLVRAVPTDQIGEVTKTRAPAVFLELGYHDNVEDATWVENNIEGIARNLVLSLTEYFGIPFVEPMEVKQGRVNVSSGTLNLRSRPELSSRIIASMPDGAALSIVGQWKDWYVVNYRGLVGYALSRYIE
jgi:N-acetylmuramoyl-L-alanine amidase